jgi:hypothetical protein
VRVILLVGSPAGTEAAFGLCSICDFVGDIAFRNFLLGSVQQSFGQGSVLVDQEVEVSLLEVVSFF